MALELYPFQDFLESHRYAFLRIDYLVKYVVSGLVTNFPTGTRNFPSVRRPLVMRNDRELQFSNY